MQLPAQSLPHDWFGATAAKLEGPAKTFFRNVCLNFENGVDVNTTTLTLFPQNTQDFCSINHRQSVNTQPTHPPCLCLQGMSGQGCPAKRIIILFAGQPQEIKPGDPSWYLLVARHQGFLPQTSLTEAALAFQARERPPCRLSLSPGKTVCNRLNHFFTIFCKREKPS